MVWSYQTSKLPYQIDNFVIDNGLWKVLGNRNLAESPSEEFVPFDIRSSIVDSSSYFIPTSGFLVNIEEGENNQQTWTLELLENESIQIVGEPKFINVSVRDCSEDPNTDPDIEPPSCFDQDYVDTNTTDYEQFIGDYISVDIAGEYDSETEEWEAKMINVLLVTLY